MAHFARVINNFVVDIIVADKKFIDSGIIGNPSEWIQTSYNTKGGVHYDPKTKKPDDGIALRKNYAGIGFTYDRDKDAFIPPQPYNSWTLNEETCLWEAPVAYPEDGQVYLWDELNLQWVLDIQ